MPTVDGHLKINEPEITLQMHWLALATIRARWENRKLEVCAWKRTGAQAQAEH
jgi:hypothetical protein